MYVMICDDDKIDREKIRELLSSYGNSHRIDFSVSEYQSGADLLQDMEKGQGADIVILDINLEKSQGDFLMSDLASKHIRHMPKQMSNWPDAAPSGNRLKEMDGLTVAGHIRKLRGDIPIVFITAFIDYALEGYKVRANRFLIKDNLEQTFDECMDDICAEIQRKEKAMLFDCVEGRSRIKTSEIVMFEASGRQSIIHTENGEYHIYRRMDDLEIDLRPHGFLRVHRSYLVNMGFIRNIKNYSVELTSGARFSIPKARYRKVLREYTMIIGETV